MERTPQLRNLKRAFKIARFANKKKISTATALEMAAEGQHKKQNKLSSRRDFLAQVSTLTGAGALMSAGLPWRKAMAAPSLDIGIVGAGLAGLSCAYELKKSGVMAKVYEANTRIGGRCWSMADKFPGQVIERGGELIDNLHKTMIGYAREFGLTLEDVSKAPGDVFYFFNNQWYQEAVVVDQYRQFVEAMHGDLRSLSGDVTALSHTDQDIRIDLTSLADYLNGANSIGLKAGPIAHAAITQAYVAEYGLATSEQSCLNFLQFIHADKRSKFTPFGVFSDERFHIVEGNEGVVNGLTSRLQNQIALEMKLVKAKKTATGIVELTFKQGTNTITKTHDAVVFAIPFTTLRNIELDPSLSLSPQKFNAIKNLGYGTNAKMMTGFQWRAWADQGGNGAAYADLPNFQASWETNPSKAGPGRAVLTDYSSAARGANLDPRQVQKEVAKFLADGNKVFPGLQAAASKTANGRDILVHLEHWPSNPNTLGSYTCYRPGQFTTIAGHEGTAENNLFFAGEHANSFYVWQGFMEGAALSGIDAAAQILRK